MLKKILIGGMAGAMLFSSAVFAADVNVNLNGEAVEFSNQQPVIVDGRTLIPLRGVFEEVGYVVEWEPETKTATLDNGANIVVVTAGEADFIANGEVKTADVPAQIINGSMMLPLRAIGEGVGGEVEWDAETKTATITVDIDDVTLFFIAINEAVAPLEAVSDEIEGYFEFNEDEINEIIENYENPEEIVEAVAGLIDEDEAEKFLENADRYAAAFDETESNLRVLTDKAPDEETAAMVEVYADMLGSVGDVLSGYKNYINGVITSEALAEQVSDKIKEITSAFNVLLN